MNMHVAKFLALVDIPCLAAPYTPSRTTKILCRSQKQQFVIKCQNVAMNDSLCTADLFVLVEMPLLIMSGIFITVSKSDWNRLIFLIFKALCKNLYALQIKAQIPHIHLFCG